MGIFKGGALRIFQSFLYALEFLCAAIILGIYSYFLSVLADRNAPISRQSKAIEGLSGAATLYLIFATILTCCLGGVSFFAFLAIVLDVCFIGAMIAIAIMTRSGASSCRGNVNTPLGSGPASSRDGFDGNITYSVRLGTACRLNTACFAVAIIAAFLFLITAVMQLALIRNHKKEKRFGPSPSNNYTSGSGKRKGLFAGRKNKKAAAARDAELGTTGGLAAPMHDTRPSHETGYTGTTVGGTNGVATAPYDKVEGTHGHHNGVHSGYHTQPTGTGVNPYGYTNATTTTGTATNY